MSKVHWRLYYHVVWATRMRAPMIEPEIKERVLGAIRAKCEGLGIHVRELNAVADHAHLCCDIPPSLAISSAMREIKGVSSHMVNHELSPATPFAWQEGYGVMSLSARDVRRVVEYIEQQERHHADGSLLAPLEAADDE